ncbi:hypothetical protein D3C84_863030 [compost metagenome]
MAAIRHAHNMAARDREDNFRLNRIEQRNRFYEAAKIDGAGVRLLDHIVIVDISRSVGLISDIFVLGREIGVESRIHRHRFGAGVAVALLDMELAVAKRISEIELEVERVRFTGRGIARQPQRDGCLSFFRA